jgi:demethylmenaquinone methyltransferase / 2-methoxy-6-polyprenyl-1,4-benzoquinol methylase
MTTDQLPDPASGPGKDAALVQRMFDRVAPRYDLANAVFSLGQDRHWRQVAVRAVDPRAGDVVVDVAAGTGALSHELAVAGATVVALDFSWNMLATGRQRATGRATRPLWCNGDGNRLPFADASVDAVTIAFGLRNLPDPTGGLAEFLRIVRPGGRLAVLEFSQPVWAPFRHVYANYLTRAMPAAAKVLTSDPAAYRYLAESIRRWPVQEQMAGIIAGAGWERVQWKNLSGGIVALHRATRPTNR